MNEKEELLDLARSLRRRLEKGGIVVKAVTAEPHPAASSVKAPASSLSSAERLSAVAEKVASCQLCPLGKTRIKAVPGVGSPDAQVMFIGEGPGYQEDRQGEPFVGPAGQLLDKILEAIGLSRATVYIANVVKCHPMKDPSDPEARGNDRPPTPEESAACRPFLDEQIGAIKPRVIVTLGASATRELLGEPSITRVRGQWRSYTPAGGDPVKVLPTFHPAALLRDPALKRDVWTDMKNLKAELE